MNFRKQRKINPIQGESLVFCLIFWQSEFCEVVEDFAPYSRFGFLIFDEPVFQSAPEAGFHAEQGTAGSPQTHSEGNKRRNATDRHSDL
jgi:hypothetical protein